MSTVITRACPKCRRRMVGRIRSERGQLIEEWPVCPCELGATALVLAPDELSYEERVSIARKTGVCIDCDRPVAGTRGKALRCEDHKRRARLDQANASKRRPEGARKRRQYERRHRRKNEVRAKRLARRRELHAERMANDPEYRETYRRRRQRETSIKHPGYQKRIDYFNRTNADPERAERKRQHAHRRYYELHPERPDPHCATCGERIEWSPPGRPPKYHQTEACLPYRRPSRDRRAA